MPYKVLRRFPEETSPNALREMTQPERARALAANCGSSTVAGLLEVHAQLCEQNAKPKIVRPRRRNAPRV